MIHEALSVGRTTEYRYVAYDAQGNEVASLTYRRLPLVITAFDYSDPDQFQQILRQLVERSQPERPLIVSDIDHQSPVYQKLQDSEEYERVRLTGNAEEFTRLYAVGTLNPMKQFTIGGCIDFLAIHLERDDEVSSDRNPYIRADLVGYTI